MKTVFLSFLFCFTTHFLKAQDYKYIYYLDEHLTSVPAKEATIIGKGFIENGNLHLDCYLARNSFLFFKVDYLDTTLQTYNGPYSIYYEDGNIQEAGTYKNDLLEGPKEKWDEKGELTDSLIYHDDKVFTEYNFRYYNNKLTYSEIKDSLADTLYSQTFDENNKITNITRFKGDKGIVQIYKGGVAQIDSVFTRDKIEASFPGGQQAWSLFLRRNLNPMVPVDNNAKAGVYTVIVKFMVNKDGEISNIEPETHYGYGMEQEVIRLIEKSPKWIPAIEYGRNINAYRRQPATFVVGKD